MIDDIISQDMIQENNYSLCNKQWVRIVFNGISFVYARAKDSFNFKNMMFEFFVKVVRKSMSI